MAFRRTPVKIFQLGNPLYVNATVTFVAIDNTGSPTTTLIPLFTGQTGATQAANPQTLDSSGRLQFPVWHDQPFVAKIGNAEVPNQNTAPWYPDPGGFQGQWATGTVYNIGDEVADPANGNLYIAQVTHTAGASLAVDVAAGKWLLLVDVSAVAASQAAAATSAGLAAAAAASIIGGFTAIQPIGIVAGTLAAPGLFVSGDASTGVAQLAGIGTLSLVAEGAEIARASATGLSTALKISSTLATGTAPLSVSSTTRVANLNVASAGNADTVTTNANLTGPITSIGNTTAVAAQTGTGSKFVMDTSPTLVTPNIGVATGASLSVSGQLSSTVATGTAPLAVSSTTQVSNLNVSQLVGATWAAPADIGTGVPASAIFTTVTVTTANPTTAGAVGYAAGLLTWGDGAANHQAVSSDQTQTLTNKTLTSPTITGTGSYTGNTVTANTSLTTATANVSGVLSQTGNFLISTAANGSSGGWQPNALQFFGGGGVGNGIYMSGADVSTLATGWSIGRTKSNGSSATNDMNSTAGAISFPNVGTTASGANAFLDNAASNNLLRSTSSRKYKAGFTALDLTEIRAIASAIRPGRYFSCAPADDPREAHFGVLAEDLAPTCRPLVGFDTLGDPDWVKYDRIGILAFPLLADLETRLAAIEQRFAS